MAHPATTERRGGVRVYDIGGESGPLFQAGRPADISLTTADIAGARPREFGRERNGIINNLQTSDIEGASPAMRIRSSSMRGSVDKLDTAAYTRDGQLAGKKFASNRRGHNPLAPVYALPGMGEVQACDAGPVWSGRDSLKTDDIAGAKPGSRAEFGAYTRPQRLTQTVADIDGAVPNSLSARGAKRPSFTGSRKGDLDNKVDVADINFPDRKPQFGRAEGRHRRVPQNPLDPRYGYLDPVVGEQRDAREAEIAEKKKALKPHKQGLEQKLFDHVYSKVSSAQSVFRKFDKDQDNTLSYSEFREGLKEGFGVVLTDDEMSTVAKQMDADMSGKIDYKEFARGIKRGELAAIADPRTTLQAKGYKHPRFTSSALTSHLGNAGLVVLEGKHPLVPKVNGSVVARNERDMPMNTILGTSYVERFLTREELDELKVRQEVKEKIESRGTSTRNIFRKFDKDKDNLISRDEFTTVLAEIGVKANKAAVNRIFESLDKDNTGTIDYVEFSENLGRLHLLDEAAERQMSRVDLKNQLLGQNFAPKSSLRGVKAQATLDKSAANISKRKTIIQAKKKLEEFMSKYNGVQQMYRSMDENKDGGVDMSEFRASMRSKNIIMTDEENNYLTELFDKDGDGKVTQKEFTAAVHNLAHEELHLEQDALCLDIARKVSKMEANPREAFKKFDKDGSGSLSQYEFQKALQSIGVLLNANQFRKLLTVVDKDSSNVINYNEFAAMLARGGIPIEAHLPPRQPLSKSRAIGRVELADSSKKPAQVMPDPSMVRSGIVAQSTATTPPMSPSEMRRREAQAANLRQSDIDSVTSLPP